MLIHKETLGVLEFAPWDGTFRKEFDVWVPVQRPATLAGLGLDPAEWWEVENRSALAVRVKICYPWFDPVVIDGELVDITPWPGWKVYGEEEPEPVAIQAGKSRRRRRRRQYCSAPEGGGAKKENKEGSP